MNKQVQYLSDKQLTNISANGFSFMMPKTSSSSHATQKGSHNILIVQSAAASNGGSVVQNVNVYTAPVTYNSTKNLTFVF